MNLDTASCFVLLFDAKPKAENRFTLSIRGVQREGVEIELPVLSFVKGKYTEVGVAAP